MRENDDSTDGKYREEAHFTLSALLYMAMDKHASTANIEIVHQFQCKISF
jgi:hypothetical protein